MQSASSTASSHQLATTPTTESAFSSSSARHGTGQGGGNDTPPTSPRFNLPDSYWSQPRDDRHADRLSEPSGFSGLVARHVAESRQGQDILLKAIEMHLEDRENDPRFRSQGQARHIDITPFQASDFSLSAEALARLVVLKDFEGEEPQLQSSTSSTTSAATVATRQDNAASGCCIPPSCTIL